MCFWTTGLILAKTGVSYTQNLCFFLSNSYFLLHRISSTESLYYRIFLLQSISTELNLCISSTQNFLSTKSILHSIYIKQISTSQHVYCTIYKIHNISTVKHFFFMWLLLLIIYSTVQSLYWTAYLL